MSQKKTVFPKFARKGKLFLTLALSMLSLMLKGTERLVNGCKEYESHNTIFFSQTYAWKRKLLHPVQYVQINCMVF